MNERYRMVWTDGGNDDFLCRARLLDDYYYNRFGEQALQYKPYNTSVALNDAVVVYDKEKPIACGAFHILDKQTVEVKRVFVLPAYRRQGLAVEVMDMLEQRARQKGYHAAVLETGVDMQDAIDLYKSMGYLQIKGYAHFKDDESCVCMKKELI